MGVNSKPKEIRKAMLVMKSLKMQHYDLNNGGDFLMKETLCGREWYALTIVVILINWLGTII